MTGNGGDDFTVQVTIEFDHQVDVRAAHDVVLATFKLHTTPGAITRDFSAWRLLEGDKPYSNGDRCISFENPS